MNPPVTSARSHHSLKNSYIFDKSSTPHVNPTPGKISLVKKYSLNPRAENAPTQESLCLEDFKQSCHTRYDSNIQQYGSTNNNYISLGYTRPKAQSHRESTANNQPIVSSMTNIKDDYEKNKFQKVEKSMKAELKNSQILNAQKSIIHSELNDKIFKIMQTIKGYQIRISALERSNEQNSKSKQEVKSIVIEHLQTLETSRNEKMQKIKMKKQLEQMIESNIKLKYQQALKNAYKIQQQMSQRIQQSQKMYKQALINNKNGIYHELLDIENKINKNRKKDLEKIKQEMQKLNQHFISQLHSLKQKDNQNKNLLNLKPVMPPTPSNKINLFNQSQEKQKHSKQGNKSLQHLLSQLESLIDNPYLRLKFLGRVSFIGAVPQNPQVQKEIESIQMIYKIDKQGYLLDEESRYIMDSENKLIRLDEQHLKILGQYRMLG